MQDIDYNCISPICSGGFDKRQFSEPSWYRVGLRSGGFGGLEKEHLVKKNIKKFV